MKDPHYRANVAITLAFLVTGFEAAHCAALASGVGTLPEQHAETHGGHIGIVANLYDYAEHIEDCISLQNSSDFPGVIQYEVIEPLGKWLFNNPDAFTEYPSDLFLDHASNTIDRWFNPAPSGAQPETSTMKISTLIRLLTATLSEKGDLDVLTRGSEPQKMVDALEVRVVKTSKRTAVFIGKPKATND